MGEKTKVILSTKTKQKKTITRRLAPSLVAAMRKDIKVFSRSHKQNAHLARCRRSMLCQVCRPNRVDEQTSAQRSDVVWRRANLLARVLLAAVLIREPLAHCKKC